MIDFVIKKNNFMNKGIDIIYYQKYLEMSKSPIKDYGRLLGNSRTLKKEQPAYVPFRYRNFESSDRIVEELRAKLQLSLKHNAKLLDENSVLNELISQLKFQVRGISQQMRTMEINQSQNMKKSEGERAKLLDEIQIKQKFHEGELEKLISEISVLHQEKNNLEMEKNRQLDTMKVENEKNLVTQIQNLKKYQNNSKDLYQTQISNLKEVIDRQNYQIQTQNTQHKLQANRLNENIKSLEGQIKHLRHIRDIEQKDLRKNLMSELNNEKRNLQREKQIQETNFNTMIKSLKHQIMDKNQEIDALSKRAFKNDEIYSSELENLKRQKEGLLSDLANVEVQHLNVMSREKSKLREISEQEVKNINDLNQTHIEELRSEINKLRNLIDCKSNELRRVYQENEEVKRAYGTEVQNLKKGNEELRKRTKKIQKDHLEELEVFKVKMGVLIESNLKGINTYYLKEIETMTQNNHELQKINASVKEKLYKVIEDNDELRKTFQIQISKQKARVQDLKIKLAAIQLEHKDYVTSLGSKMQMTSQTLVREADQKNRSQSFFEAEKKKFHALSLAKDRQINELVETMHRMKKMHQSQLDALKTEKKELRDQAEMAEQKIVRMKDQLEEELKIRIEKYKSEEKPDNSKLVNEVKQLYQKNQTICNENIKLQKQVQHLARDNRALAQELGLYKGHVETLQLQSCAAIEDEKSKLKIVMGNNEISMRQYYEEKLQSREKDIAHLKKVVGEKEDDIRELIVKYNGLEKRLMLLLEQQQKASNLEERIKNLGMDTNLVKNIAQLFTRD